MSAPLCNICTGRQPYPKRATRVYHQHYSSREMRIVQGVEYNPRNKEYMCPSCEAPHPAWPDCGLNVCLSTSQLHEFHTPRDQEVICPPDPIHVDWLTIPGATIATLETAWQVDYLKSGRPMRILLVAGLNDLLKGGNMESLTNSILTFKNAVDDQNHYHPRIPNELVVSTLLNPPIITWFPDNGRPPRGHVNRLEEITAINNWIVEFNQGYGHTTPRFHRFGVRMGRKMENGVSVPMHVHQFRKWRQTEPVDRMLHLNDYWRIRLGGAVIKHFKTEISQRGVLG